jgi:hypothetical protein
MKKIGFVRGKVLKNWKAFWKVFKGKKVPAGYWLTTPALEIYVAGANAINNIILLYIKDCLL